MLITGIKDYGKWMEEIQRFLPCIDNWATCDYPAPKCFARHKDQVLEEAKRWISSGETYVIRYGIGMLMRLFPGRRFSSEYLEMAAAVSIPGVLCKDDGSLVLRHRPCQAMGCHGSLY